MNPKTHPIIIVIIFLIILAALYGLSSIKTMAPMVIRDMQTSTTTATSSSSTEPVGVVLNTITYLCDNNKSVTASYMDDPARMSTSTGSVRLTLSDGRIIVLSQTTSADGARYTSRDGDIVFWSKGTGFTFTENGKQTFPGCIQVATDPGGLPQVYENSIKGFSVRYPSGYVVNDKYTYEMLGPGKGIQGVKFTIPASLTTGTNLSTDSYISVEHLSNLSACTASPFLSDIIVSKDVTENSVMYSVASSSDAAMGNRYEEIVYAIPNSSPCVGIRYFIHYGAIANYPTGVKEFDREALLKVFDAIRRTVVLGR